MLANNLLIHETAFFENTAKVIPPSNSCLKGKIVLATGRPAKLLERPLYDSTNNIDTTSKTTEHDFPIGPPITSPNQIVWTDNQLVRLKDGSLLAAKNSCVWDDIRPNPPVWFDEPRVYGCVSAQSRQRGSVHLFRSTNCGSSWQLRSIIDFATFLNGKYGYPRPSKFVNPHLPNSDVQTDVDPNDQDIDANGNRLWWIGGGDRTEVYSCPFTGYVYLTTRIISGPYYHRPDNYIAPGRNAYVLFYSTDSGQTWQPINKEFPGCESLVMTSTPNGRLFLFQVCSDPLVYFSTQPVNAAAIPEISPGYPVHYMEGNVPIPAALDRNDDTTDPRDSRYAYEVAQHSITYAPAISRLSADKSSNKIRVAYQALNTSGRQEYCIVDVDVQNPNQVPVITPLRIIRAENPNDYSALFGTFIDPDYIDMPDGLISNLSVFYWLEAPRKGLSSKQYAIRYIALEDDHSSDPAYLSVKDSNPRTWATRQDIGDYMTGGLFWKDNTLNYLAQWVEPDGIKANIITLPYQPPIGSLLEAEGRITFLRVHDVATGFGPPSDFLDAEVVIFLDSQPGKAFGFQLRLDENQSTHRDMADLLRNAFKKNRPVLIDYVRMGLAIGRIVRVADLRSNANHVNSVKGVKALSSEASFYDCGKPYGKTSEGDYLHT
jgi:hypothetical protein